MESKAKKILGLTDKEILDSITQIQGLATDAEDVYMVKVSDDDWNSIKKLREAFRYEGFNPLIIIKEFLARADAQPVSSTDLPIETKIPGDKVIKIYDKCHPQTDLLFFITLFLERGNNVSKILLKCDKMVADIIKRKCSQYNINLNQRVPGSAFGANVITLARLSQAFPFATASAIVGHLIEGKLKSRIFSGVQLPLLMQHSIFPSLIPDHEMDLIEIAKFLNLEMSILLSTPKEKRKMELTSLGELYEKSVSFVNAAVNGSLIPNEVRVKILKKGGILEGSSLTAAPLAMSAIVMRAMMYKDASYMDVVKKLKVASSQSGGN